jgi:hypothetical protein
LAIFAKARPPQQGFFLQPFVDLYTARLFKLEGRGNVRLERRAGEVVLSIEDRSPGASHCEIYVDISG